MQPGSSARQSLYGILFVLFTLLSTSCASGPELEKYPRPQIDRPYTLPKGVASWTFAGIAIRAPNTNSYPGYNPWSGGANPLIFTQSLSEDWNILWAPIPIAAQYQIHHDAEKTVGLFFGVESIGYGSSNGISVGPSFQVSYRQKFDHDFAWTGQLYGSREFSSWTSNGDWAGMIATGPFLQVTSEFAVQAWVGAHLDCLHRYDLNDFFVSTNPNPSIKTKVSWVFPVVLSADYSISRQWNTSLMIATHKAGLVIDSGDADLDFIGQLVHYW